MNYRGHILIISFLIVSIGLMIVAIPKGTIKDDITKYIDVESVEITKFQGIKYYLLEEKREKLFFKADTFEIEAKEMSTFTKPDGKYFVSDKWVDFKAETGTFKDQTGELVLEDQVFFSSDDSKFNANRLYLNQNKKFLEARGDVNAVFEDRPTREKIEINANYLNSWLNEQRSLFVGNVTGKIQRNRRYEGRVDFASERLEYQQTKLLISLEKDVEIKRNNYNLRAQKGDIFLENFNKKLKYYSLYDDIKLVEKLRLRDGTPSVRRAFAEKLEGFISEGKIILSGTPRVERGNDEIKGLQITLRENVDVIEVIQSQSSFDIKRK